MKYRIQKSETNHLWYLQKKSWFKWRDVEHNGKKITNANTRDIVKVSEEYLLNQMKLEWR